jgi:hypothetical protein
MSNSSRTVDAQRRQFMLKAGMGLGAVSLGGLVKAAAPAKVHGDDIGASDLGILKTGQFPARAKRVIFMHTLGAMSQVDTFDYKPTLVKMHGKEMPASVMGTQRLSTMSSGQGSFPIVAPIAKFSQYGQSGAWVSDLLPYTGGIVDDLCFIKSVHTEHVNHDPASKFLHTGFQIAGRPSAGAWVSYALGSDNVDLPNYVVLNSGPAYGVPLDGNTWGPGFLPSQHQGVPLRSGRDPVLYVNNPSGLRREDRRSLLDALARFAKTDYEKSKDADIFSRMSQYEMAYRMQRSIPEATDISNEPKHVLEMYGPDVERPGTFAHNCLLARRLAERNVKYILNYAMGFDHHTDILTELPKRCRMVDQPAAALVKDLKQRGLLDDTIIMFGGEFGRTPFAQGSLTSSFGRDHHGGASTWWMAGGGVKAGHTHGETDDFSFNIVKEPVHIHDLQATLLHLMGVDHERLTYRFQGRDFRLTDVEGKALKEVFA